MMIYLASPYTCKFVDDAVRAELMRAGVHVLSPIVHSHPIAIAHDLPTDFWEWQALDEDLIDRCDEVWVLTLPGWDTSRGVQSKIAYALDIGLPVRYVDPADVTAPLRELS